MSFGETEDRPVVGNEKGHGNFHNGDDAPCEKDKVIVVGAVKGKGDTKINDGGNYVQAGLNIERNMGSLEATDKPQSTGVLSCQAPPRDRQNNSCDGQFSLHSPRIVCVPVSLHIICIVSRSWSVGLNLGATTANPTRTPRWIARAIRSRNNVSDCDSYGEGMVSHRKCYP